MATGNGRNNRPALQADAAFDGAASANVTTASTTPIASNPDRIEVIITNDSDTTIYLGLGTAAVLNKGIRLNASGGSATITSFTGGIRAIHGGSGNKVLCWAEV